MGAFPVYSFPLIFICKRHNFLYFLWIFLSWFNVTAAAYLKHLSLSLIVFYCCFSGSISSQENLYMIHHNLEFFFMTFAMQQINTIKDKMTTFDRFFWAYLISRKKWFNKFLNNLFNLDFYVIILWMHYMLFISVFRKNKVDCLC